MCFQVSIDFPQLLTHDPSLSRDLPGEQKSQLRWLALVRVCRDRMTGHERLISATPTEAWRPAGYLVSRGNPD
jgi:hypothetical protein